MAVIDDIKAKTRKQAVSGIEEKVAISLKESWSLIRLAAKKKGKELPKDPTEKITGATPEETERLRAEEWLRLSRELIDDGPEGRKMKVNGVTLSLAELDESLTEDMKKSLRITSFAQLVPKRKQVELIADTMSESVAKNSGTGIGFLDNLFGGASLGDVFMGLFSWIFSGFKGGFGGLKETIANRTGDRLKAGVVNDLTALQNKLKGTDMDISAFMGPDAIRQVGEEVGKAPAQSLKPDTSKPGAAITAAKLGGFEEKMRNKVRGMIEDDMSKAIDKAFRENPQFADLYKQEKTFFGMSVEDMKNTAGASEKYNKLKALDSVRAKVSARVSALIVDKDYVYKGNDPKLEAVKGMPLRQMKPEAKAMVLAYEARETIRGLAVESKTKGEGLEDFYALLATSMPGEIQKAIDKQSNDIPWFISGELDPAKLVGVTDTTLTQNQDEMRRGANELKASLAKGMQDLLYPGGKASKEAEEIEVLAGAALKKVHFEAVAGALAPVMYEVVNTPAQKKEFEEGLAKNGIDGKPDDKARTDTLVKLADRFKAELQKEANVKAINVEGVKLSPEAMELAAMRMAETFAKEKLGLKDTPAGYVQLMEQKKTGIADKLIGGEIRTNLTEQKAELDALIDPTLRPPPAPPATASLTPQDMDKMNAAIAAGVKPFATKPNFTKDIATDKLKYTSAHSELSTSIYKELEKDGALPFSKETKQAMADEIAMKFLDKQGKVPDQTQKPGAPAGTLEPNPLKAVVRQKVSDSRKLAAQDLVKKSVAMGLKDPASANMLKAANGGKEVNADAAGEAVNVLLAEKLTDKAKLMAMNEAEYKSLIDDVRVELDKNRGKLNIAPGKEGDALLDIMSVRIATGAVKSALKDKAPKVPKGAVEKEKIGEAALASSLIPAMVREKLLPKLTGARSVSDSTKDAGSTNLIMANSIAMDAAMAGTRVNPEVVIKNVSDVVLYYKLKRDQDKAPIDEDHLRTHIRGALTDPAAGLGPTAIAKLTEQLTTQIKDTIENPDKTPTAQEVAEQKAEEKRLADNMLRDVKWLVNEQVKSGLDKKAKDEWLAWYATDDEKRKVAAEAASEAAERILKGEELRDSKPFVDHDLENQRGMVWDHVNGSVDAKLKSKKYWNNTGWIEVVSNGVADSMRDNMTPEVAKGKPFNPINPSYVDNADAPMPGAPLTKMLRHKRQSIHDQTKLDIEAFRQVQTLLPAMLPEARSAALAVERFTDRFVNADNPKPTYTVGDGYKTAVLEYLAEEQKGLALPADARKDVALASANAMREKFAKVQQYREGLFKLFDDQARDSLKTAADLKKQVVLSGKQVAAEDYIAGMPKDDALAKQLSELQKKMDDYEKAYDAQVKALDEGLRKRAQAAQTQLLAMQKAERPGEMHNRAQLEGIVEAYRKQSSKLDMELGQFRWNAYGQQKELYAKLPELHKAAPAVQDAYSKRMAARFAAPTAKDVTERSEAFKRDLALIRGELRKPGGAANVKKMFEERRVSMGLKPDGSGKPLSAEERTAAKDKLLLPIEFDARNPASPTTPENLMAKAALAFPEAADEAKRRGLPLDVMLEKKVRELLPEWHSMKPEKVVPATLTEAEKGYSDMARAYLTAFDQLEIVTLTQDGTTEMAFLYDKPLPGYEAPDGKLTSLPANIFMPNPNDPEDQKFQTAPFTFEMENDRGEKIGRSFTINQLTPQGKKDMIDLASGLQARIDDKTTSDTDRKKYQQFMGSLKATADAQVEWYKKGDKKNDSWKEVKAILDDPNQLRKYAKGELKLKLSKEQEVVQAMPPAAKELRAAFEAEIKALGAMKGAELTAELTKRRTALGTKADGTAMGADEIKAAGAAVLPEEQRKPGSAKSPITPETLMAKAALAWPEKMPAQREDDLRRQLPEVMKLRPKFKLDAAIAKADENRSPKTKELLAFLDEAKVYSEGEGAAKKSFMFDDLSPPGYTSRKSGQKIDLPDLEVATLFETKQMEYPTTSGGIFRVQELTQKGKQDMADLAASLQLRIDAKDIPDTEKQKYRDMLGDIQELAKNREERYSNRTEYGVTAQDTWKDVRRVIGTQAALRDYVAGKLKLELTDDAKKVAAMSGDKAALRKEFEAELKALGALKGADLDKAIGERRKKLGLKTDSTPMTPAEITAAGAAVLPDGERKADSSKSPLVPENMREKAALAWPEKTEMERELEIRKQLPEWKRVQPKSKMQATFDAMYTGDSDAVKTLLAFIDSTRLIDGKDGGTPEKQVVYDASLYGINTGATFTAMSADLVVNQESFQIQTRDGKKGGKSWYVYDLSEKGYKDAMDTAVALQKRINTAGITKEEKDKYQYFLDDLVKTVEDKSKSMEAFEMTDGKGGNRWVELNNKMKPTLAALNQNKGSTVQAPVIPTFDPQNPLAAITALTTAYAAVDLKAGHKDAKPGGPTMPAK